MKVTDNRKSSKPQKILATEIPKGTVFTGSIIGIYSGTFLRTYDRVILLDSDLTQSWGPLEYGPTIENYVPVNAELIITTKE